MEVEVGMEMLLRDYSEEVEWSSAAQSDFCWVVEVLVGHC